MAVEPTIPVGWRRVVLIGLRILFGLVFIGAGASKLLGSAMMVQEFERFADYGLGRWFRYLTGALEIAGALLLIRSRTVTMGAALLACISVGAMLAQAVVLHGDVIHGVVFAGLLGWVAYAYRNAARPA